MFYDIDGNIISEGSGGASHTDAECTEAFMAYLNSRRAVLGMSGSYFANPSGLTQDSYATPQDLLKLIVAVCANPTALDIWSAPAQDFTISGSNARTLHIANAVQAAVEADVSAYRFLGGKGGSLNYGYYHRSQVLMFEIDGETVAMALMGYGQTSFNNIFKSAGELCSMVHTKLAGGTPEKGTNLTELVSSGGGFAAVPVPPAPGAYANQISPTELLTMPGAVYEGQTARRWPCSNTKAITMLCALDWIRDLHMTFKVAAADIDSGSGSTYYAGDAMTADTMLKIMMMESSNTLANAVARNVGRIILSYGG